MVAPLPTPHPSGWLLTYPPSRGNGPGCSMARLSAPRSPGPQPTLLAHGPSCSASQFSGYDHPHGSDGAEREGTEESQSCQRPAFPLRWKPKCQHLYGVEPESGM